MMTVGEAIVKLSHMDFKMQLRIIALDSSTVALDLPESIRKELFKAHEIDKIEQKGNRVVMTLGPVIRKEARKIKEKTFKRQY